MKQLDVVRKNKVLPSLVIATLIFSMLAGVLTVAVASGDTSGQTKFRYDVSTEGIDSTSDERNISATPFESLSEFEQAQIQESIGDGQIYGGGEVTKLTTEKKQTVIDGVDVVSIDGVTVLVTVEESKNTTISFLSLFTILSYLITLGLILVTADTYHFANT